MSWISLCTLDELTEAHGKYVEIDGFKLAVFLDNGQPYAIDNECPHAGRSLSAGVVENGCAVCPVHEWRFRLTDGLMPGSGVKVHTYPIRLFNRPDKPPMVQANLPTP